MDSTESKFYPTANGMPFKRARHRLFPARIRTRAPPAPWHRGGRPNTGLRNNQLPTILDNMLADHRLPAMVAIMIAPGPGGERSMGYDTVSSQV